MPLKTAPPLWSKRLVLTGKIGMLWRSKTVKCEKELHFFGDRFFIYSGFTLPAFIFSLKHKMGILILCYSKPCYAIA